MLQITPTLKGQQADPKPAYVLRAEELEQTLGNKPRVQEGEEVLYAWTMEVCCMDREVTREYYDVWTHPDFRQDAAALVKLVTIASEVLEGCEGSLTGTPAAHLKGMCYNTGRRLEVLEMMDASDNSWSSRLEVDALYESIGDEASKEAPVAVRR